MQLLRNLAREQVHSKVISPKSIELSATFQNQNFGFGTVSIRQNSRGHFPGNQLLMGVIAKSNKLLLTQSKFEWFSITYKKVISSMVESEGPSWNRRYCTFNAKAPVH